MCLGAHSFLSEQNSSDGVKCGGKETGSHKSCLHKKNSRKSTMCITVSSPFKFFLACYKTIQTVSFEATEMKCRSILRVKNTRVS